MIDNLLWKFVSYRIRWKNSEKSLEENDEDERCRFRREREEDARQLEQRARQEWETTSIHSYLFVQENVSLLYFLCTNELKIKIENVFVVLKYLTFKCFHHTNYQLTNCQTV